jgi:pimeloyl-ACP methyl ester carboxylesterase
MVFILLLTLLLPSATDYFEAFFPWKERLIHQLDSESQVIKTTKGPIEYVLKGKGPVVLLLHGGGGGFDQGLLMGEGLEKAGFTLLAPSRPGYLRTPLSVGQTIQEQADAMAALIEALHLPKVAVIGFSAGAPVAHELAARHPNDVWALVLESIGGERKAKWTYKILNQLLRLNSTNDLSLWLFYLSFREYPYAAVEGLLDLDTNLPKEARKKRKEYVMTHPRQFRFFKHFLFSMMPISPRAAGMRNDLANLRRWDHFTSPKTPTLVIQAKNDRNASLLDLERIKRDFPQAKIVPVEDSGHLIWLGKEAAKWENRLIDFLKANAP